MATKGRLNKTAKAVVRTNKDIKEQRHRQEQRQTVLPKRQKITEATTTSVDTSKATEQNRQQAEAASRSTIQNLEQQKTNLKENPTKAPLLNNADEMNNFAKSRGYKQIETQNPLLAKQHATNKQDNNLFQTKGKGTQTTESLLGGKQSTVESKLGTKHEVYDAVNTYTGLDSFNVNTITPELEAQFSDQQKRYEAMRAAVPLSTEIDNNTPMQDVEFWYVVDGNKAPSIEDCVQSSYKTVGRDRLNGIRSTDEFVIYDKRTHKIYRYDVDDETSAKLKDEVEKKSIDYSLASAFANNSLMRANWRIEDAQLKLEQLKSQYEKTGITDQYVAEVKSAYDEYSTSISNYNTLLEQYKPYLNNLADKYTTAVNKYNDYGVFGVSKDYAEKTHEAYVQYKSDKHTSDEIKAAMANTDDPTDINSLKDLLVGATHIQNGLPDTAALAGPDAVTQSGSNSSRISSTPFAGYNTIKDLENAYFNKKMAAYELYKSGTITLGDMNKIILSNQLTDLAETVDFLTGQGMIKAITADATPYLNAYLTAVKNGTTVYDEIEEARARYKEKFNYSDSALERLKSYLGENGTSVQYDWQTDSGVLNFLLEVVSDPTLILGGVGKAGAKSAAETAARRAIKSVEGISAKQADDIAETVAKTMDKGLEKSVAEAMLKNDIKLTKDNLDTVVKNLNNELLNNSAYKISKSLVDVNDAIDTMSSTIFTAETFGLNKALKPVAETGLHAIAKVGGIAGSAIAKELKVFVDRASVILNKYSVATAKAEGKVIDPAIMAKAASKEMIENFERMSDNTVTTLLDIKPNLLKHLTEENAKEVYNTWARDELAKFIKIEPKDLDGYVNFFGLYVAEMSDSVKEEVVKEATEQYVKNLNKSEVVSYLNKDNSALLAAVNKRFLSAFELPENDLKNIWMLTDDVATKAEEIYHKAEVALGRMDKSNSNYEPILKLYSSELQAQTDRLLSQLPDIKSKVTSRSLFDNIQYYRFDDSLGLIDLEANVKFIRSSEQMMRNYYNATRYYTGNFASKPEVLLTHGADFEAKRVEDSCSEIIEKVFKNHDAACTPDTIAKYTSASISDIKTSGKVYSFDVSEVYAMSKYFDRDELDEAVDLLVNTDDPNVSAIMSLDNIAYRKIENYGNHKQLVQSIINSDKIDSVLKTALLDSLSPSKKSRIDKIINQYNISNAQEYERCVDKITRVLCNNSERTLTQRSDAIMWRNIIDGKVVNFNTVDTDHNVKALVEVLENKKFSEAVNESLYADDVNNIYFSITSCEESSLPACVTLMGPDGVAKTYINGDIDFDVTDLYARTKWGSDAASAMQRFESMKKEHPEWVMHSDDMCVAINQHLKELRKYDVVEDGVRKNSRFVGFNNSYAVSNQSGDMIRMLTGNSFEAYVHEYADVANYIRTEKGLKYFNDESYMEVRKAVDDVMHNVMLRDFQDIRTSIISDFGPNDIKRYEKLKNDFAELGEDSDLVVAMNDIINGLKNADDAITMRRTKLGNCFIEEDELIDTLRACGANITGDHLNLMKEIYKGSKIGEALDYNLVIACDKKVIGEWFNEDSVAWTGIKVMDDQVTIHAANNTCSSLNTIKQSIKHKALVEAYPAKTYDALLNDALQNGYQSQLIKSALTSDDAVQKYCVLKYVWSTGSKEMRQLNDEFVNSVQEFIKNYKPGKTKKPLFQNIGQELRYVILNGDADAVRKNYFSTYSPIRTMLKESDSKLNQLNTAYNDVVEASKAFDRIDIQLAVQAQTLDRQGFKTADRLLMAMNFAPIREKFETLKKILKSNVDSCDNAAKNIVQTELIYKYEKSGAVADVRVPNKYSDYVSNITKEMQAYNNVAIDTQIKRIESIPQQQMVQYVLNDCYNSLIIDVNSKAVIRNLGPINNIIEKCKGAGLSVVNKDGKVIIYKDRAMYDSLSVSKWITSLDDMPLNYSRDDVDIKKNGLVGTINSLRRSFRPYFNHTYDLSVGTVMTTDAFERIQELLPYEAKIPMEVYNKHGKFDCNFMCNVITDADSELNHYVNAFGSADVIGNLYSATLFAMNKMEYMQDKFNVFLNPTTSFSTMMQGSDWLTAKAALEENGFVVCKKGISKTKDGIAIPVAQKLTLNTPADFKKAMTGNYCVLRNDVYLALNEQSKSMKASLVEQGNISKVLRNIQSDYIQGWLFGRPGTWIKNVGDSNMKAVVQTHDVAYVKRRLQIGNVLDEYHKVEQEVYDALQTRYFDEATISDELLESIFAKGDYRYIDKEDFKTIFASGMHEAGGIKDTLSTIANDEIKYLKDRLEHIGAPTGYIPQVVALRKAYGVDKLTPDQKFELYDDFVALFDRHMSIDDAKAAADICMTYNPTEETKLNELVHKLPLVGKYMDFNAKQFEKAEEETRTALLMYYVKDKNKTVSQAMDKIIESQFDYSRMPKWLNTIAPFQSYKIYNSLFWLETVTKDFGIMRPMLKWYKAMDEYDEDDIQEYARLAYWTAYVESGQYAEDYAQYEDMSYAEVAIQSLNATVNEYEGTNAFSTVNMGNLKIGDSHIIKLGNALYDGWDYALSILSIPFSLNSASDFISDNIFSPLNSAYGLIKFMWDNKDLYRSDNKEYANRFKKLLDDNASGIIDTLPMFGTLATAVMQQYRNYSTLTRGLACVFPQLEEIQKEQSRPLMDVLTVLLPSVFAFQKDSYYEKPIGYDWYNQSEEYKDSHRFVIGVSTEGIAGKNPFTYVDTYGRLMKLGYTKAEAQAMMKAGWHLTEDNELAKWDFDGNLPNVLRYDSDTVNTTIGYLLQRGFTPDEAYDYMLTGIWWIDADGKEHKGTGGLQLLQDSEWAIYIDMLPDYIKYDWDNQYQQLYNHYKAQGFNHEQIMMQMLFSNGYIDHQNKFRVLTDEQVAIKTQQINDAFTEFYNELPQYCKYEDGAYSRTVKYIMQHMGYTQEHAREYMLANNSYLDQDGIFHNYSDEEVALFNTAQQAEFEDYYSKLPDRIKYEKGAFSRTLQFLKELGYSSDEAKAMMMNGYYIDEDGNISNVKGVAYTRKNYKVSYTHYRKARHKWVHYARRYRRYQKRQWTKRTRKQYTRFNKLYAPKLKKPKAYRNPKIYKAGSYSTYSKQNVYLGTNRLQKASYRVNYSRLNSKSGYPAAYRNVSYSNRNNMYKDLYAKYGTSRMLMRSGGYKAYSNASTTKLRRNAQKKQNKQNQSARLRVQRNS